MKKIFAILVAVCCISTASAVSYKGYVDTYVGYAAPSEGDGGVNYGLSTSHGIQIIDGLFAGMGVDLSVATFSKDVEVGSGRYATNTTEVDAKFLGAGFAECRYNFLRKKRISPFVGTRIGGGYNGYAEEPAFYFNPSVGCTFNFTKKFGLDVGLGYTLYNSTRYTEDDEAESFAVNCVTLKVGIHF